MSQLDKCKTCIQYVITDEYPNGIFYGCRLGRPLNFECKPQIKEDVCPSCGCRDGHHSWSDCKIAFPKDRFTL